MHWRCHPRQIPLSGSALGQWNYHGVTEAYLSGSLQESGTYLGGGIATVLARVRRQPVACLDWMSVGVHWRVDVSCSIGRDEVGEAGGG